MSSILTTTKKTVIIVKSEKHEQHFIEIEVKIVKIVITVIIRMPQLGFRIEHDASRSEVGAVLDRNSNNV